MGKGAAGGMTGIGRGIGGAMTGGNPMIKPMVTGGGMGVLPPGMGIGGQAQMPIIPPMTPPQTPINPGFVSDFDYGVKPMIDAESLNPPPVSLPPSINASGQGSMGMGAQSGGQFSLPDQPPGQMWGANDAVQNETMTPKLPGQWNIYNPDGFGMPTSRNPLPPTKVQTNSFPVSEPAPPVPMHTGTQAPQIPQSTNPNQFGPSGGMPTRNPSRIAPPMPSPKGDMQRLMAPDRNPMRPPIGQGSLGSPQGISAPALPEPKMDNDPIQGVFGNAGGPGRVNPVTGMSGPSASAPFNTSAPPPLPTGNRGTPPAPTNAPSPEAVKTSYNAALAGGGGMDQAKRAAAINALSPQDRKMLGMLLLHEGQRQGAAGMAGIADVALNRAANTGRSVREIINNPVQFSGFKPNLETGYTGNKTVTNAQIDAAINAALNAPTQPASMNATHYHANYVNPKWASAFNNLGAIKGPVSQHHIFYAGGRGKDPFYFK